MTPATVDQLDELITRPSDPVLAAVKRCPGSFAVLGAGGKMGFHVTRMLQRCLEALGRQDELSAISRFSSASSRRLFEQHGIKTIAADLSEAAQMSAIEECENVIFLAGIKFGTASDTDLLTRMNVTMPSLAAEHFRNSRIVALSTGCVYSFTTPQSGGSTEQCETDPPGHYAQSCIERERAFISGSEKYGTPCALIRLNYSIDLRYGVLVDIAQNVLSTSPIDVTTGHANVIWQGDAVSQILQCLPLATSPPLIINVTGNEVLSVRDLAERIGRRLQRTPTFTGVESDECWLSNNSLARRLLGDPTITVDAMIEWITDWLTKGGPTLGKPTQFQVRDGQY